jgi:molybdate transport system substrate-binding protein
VRSSAKAARQAATLAVVLLLCRSYPVFADDVVVMTSGAFTAAYLELVPAYEHTATDTLVTATTTMGSGAESIPSRLKRGEAADVVIVAADALDELITAGSVLADSRVDLARSSIGMAVRSGAAKPDIRSVAALTRTLLEAKSVAYSASVSGDYLRNELFPRLGVYEELKATGRRIDRERVGAVVARGDAEIGFQQISELLPISGIDIVGPLPPEAQRVTVFAAGVAANARHPEAARAFIRFLASSEATGVIVKSGLQPIDR